jgi:hypothetical protein
MGEDSLCYRVRGNTAWQITPEGNEFSVGLFTACTVSKKLKLRIDNFVHNVERFASQDSFQEKVFAALSKHTMQAPSKDPCIQHVEKSPKESSEFICYTMIYYYLSMCRKEVPTIWGASSHGRVSKLEIAAFILAKASSVKTVGDLVTWLHESGVVVGRARPLAESAQKILNELEAHISRKAPTTGRFIKETQHKRERTIQSMSSRHRIMKFWYHELMRRKFFLDATTDTETKQLLDDALEFVSKSKGAQKEILSREHCSTCYLESPVIFREVFFTLKNQTLMLKNDACECIKFIEKELCSYIRIKNTSKQKKIDLGEVERGSAALKVLYEKYNIPFHKLIGRYLMEDVIRGYMQGRLPVVKDSFVDVVRMQYDTDGQEHVNARDNNVVCFWEKQCMKFSSPKYQIDNERNIIGFWLWDAIHIEKKDCAFSELVAELVAKEWYIIFSDFRKYSDAISDYKAQKVKNGIKKKKESLTEIISAYRNSYKCVDESIRTGRLLSTNEALKRRKKQKIER